MEKTIPPPNGFFDVVLRQAHPTTFRLVAGEWFKLPAVAVHVISRIERFEAGRWIVAEPVP